MQRVSRLKDDWRQEQEEEHVRSEHFLFLLKDRDKKGAQG